MLVLYLLKTESAQHFLPFDPAPVDFICTKQNILVWFSQYFQNLKSFHSFKPHPPLFLATIIFDEMTSKLAS